MPDLRDRCVSIMEELGITRDTAIDDVIPLTGGVASDIARVEAGGRSYAIKFALPKLRVAADWHAPVHRNAAEYAWLKVVAELQPDSALALYGRSEKQHGFVMEFLTGDDVYLWKAALLNALPKRGEPEAVGALLGQVHAASSGPNFDAAPFHNQDDFYALRIEPYLVHTKTIHPGLSLILDEMADMLYQSNQVLVHGDVSPKNILFRAKGPVLLDAECATMGDASFDPSFCLNHLFLKAIHLPKSCNQLLKSVAEFWTAYQEHVNWEPATNLEARVCKLLPALMLGRVDGKSPVEYLNDPQRAFVRIAATHLLSTPATSVPEFVERLKQIMKEQSK
ncbi:aminoglycoside phosphotransferase family protein [Cognatishimia sp. WU-CL00825]|uniref:aminoglycoside phosphotransferase family protein n=1 Tax=Cognatishimia sp. WU-CL00825 TaxID=3127658 RepID=UPI0031055184